MPEQELGREAKFLWRVVARVLSLFEVALSHHARHMLQTLEEVVRIMNEYLREGDQVRELPR